MKEIKKHDIVVCEHSVPQCYVECEHKYPHEINYGSVYKCTRSEECTKGFKCKCVKVKIFI